VYVGVVALVAFLAGLVVLLIPADMGVHPTLSKRADGVVACGSALNADTESAEFADLSVYYTQEKAGAIPKDHEYARGCDDKLKPRKWIGWILVVGGAAFVGATAVIHLRSRQKPDEIRTN
jgi:hypothetical protein